MRDHPGSVEGAPGRRSILLVGDLPVHRIPLSSLLRAYGFTAVTLGEPDLVQDFLKERGDSVMLALLNLSHPAVEGVEFAKEVVALAGEKGVALAGIYDSIKVTRRDVERIGIPVAIDAFALPEEIIDLINRTLFRGKDTRRQVRIFAYFPANCRFEGEDAPCRVTSLSLGGFFLQTESIHPKGTEITFSLELGSGRRVEGSGTVVHTVRNEAASETISVSGMGVRFDRLDPEGARLLGKLYRERLDKYLAREPRDRQSAVDREPEE